MVLRLSVLAGVILGLSLTRPAHGQAAPLQTREVLIGQLDSFTGNGATFGENSKAALQVAIDDINRASVAIGSPFRFRLVTADTQLDPLLALQGLQSLAAQGVRIAGIPNTKSISKGRGVCPGFRVRVAVEAPSRSPLRFVLLATLTANVIGIDVWEQPELPRILTVELDALAGHNFLISVHAPHLAR
jgi:hypothetical protein